MAHRQFFASQMAEMDHAQIWNHQSRDRHLHLENGSSVLPADDTVVSGVNSMAYLTVARPNNYPSSSFSLEVPNHGAANSGMLHNPYLHPSSSGSPSQFQSNQVLHVPSCYNRLTIRDGGATVNAITDNRRVALKRKSPSMPLVFDREHTTGYYCAGASSNLHISSDHLQPRSMPGPQCGPLDPNSMFPSYWSGNLAGEGSQRNVRSRSHANQIETHPAGAFSSSNAPYHFHTTTNTSDPNVAGYHLHSMANISGPNVAGHRLHSMANISGLNVAGNHLHSMANISGPNVAGQCSHSSESMVPHSRILSSGYCRSNYRMNECLTGSSVTNGSMDGAYNSSLTQSRNTSSMLPTLHCASTRGIEMGLSSYDQRSTPYRPIPSRPPMVFAASPLEDAGPSRVEAVAPSSRHSRPLSTIGRSIERNGRARNSYGRFQSFPHDDNAYSRWVPEAVVMVDPLIFYDSILFDQHMDMTLDIDSMSYEELLALEERIGNVSTGLSEDSISRCLIEIMYRSSDQSQDEPEERKCAICLEEYNDAENLGRLRCGHDFHASCIKKWLLIKNACPICKAPALADTAKGKQAISR